MDGQAKRSLLVLLVVAVAAAAVVVYVRNDRAHRQHAEHQLHRVAAVQLTQAVVIRDMLSAMRSQGATIAGLMSASRSTRRIVVLLAKGQGYTFVARPPRELAAASP